MDKDSDTSPPNHRDEEEIQNKKNVSCISKTPARPQKSLSAIFSGEFPWQTQSAIVPILSNISPAQSTY